MSNEEEALVLQDGKLVPRTLGVDPGVKEYADYNEAVDDIIAQQTFIDHRVLEINWNIGRQAWLIKDKAVYGSHGIEEFAKDIDMSASSIYSFIKFYKRFTSEDVARMQEEEIPYRKGLMLMEVSDAFQRDRLEELLTDHRVNEETLKRLVANANDGVIIPEEPKDVDAYVDMCREGKFIRDEEEDDEEDEDKETEDITAEAADPGAKFISNIVGSCDELSMNITKVEECASGLFNVLSGDTFKSLDEEHLSNVSGIMKKLGDELSSMMTKCWRLRQLLPADSKAKEG